MQIIGIKTKIFKKGDNLLDFLNKNISFLNEKDVVIVTSKIVALSQKRVGALKNENYLIKKESKKIIKTPWALLTLTDNGWCINAGADKSNAKNKIILLPKNPFEIADRIRKNFKTRFKLKNIGVVITDTKSVPLRIGTVGRAIAFAGIETVKSYIGKKDLFGRKSRITQSNIPDALATSATLVMGEGDEQTPISIIKNAPIKFKNKTLSQKQKILTLSPEKDIYSPIFEFTKKKQYKHPKENHHKP